MASGDEEDAVALQDLYVKASTKKGALTRSKKAVDFALTALREAPASEHFFEELKKNLTKYRDLRDVVLDIYDNIHAQVADSKFSKDFGKQQSDIESSYEKIEDSARMVMAAHHDAVTALNRSSSARRSGTAAAGAASTTDPNPGWKLQVAFQPKSPLKLDSTLDDFHCWERDFKSYYDMSNLQHAEMNIQRTVLLNCLSPDFQTKVMEAMSAVTTMTAGLDLVREEFQKRHPIILRRHQLFCLDQQNDEFRFSDTVARMLTLAKDANLVDMSRDQILCHILLRSCTRDEELQKKLLEVEASTMTLDQLTAVIERYELIQVTAKGLGKKERGVGRRVGGQESSTRCFRCQDPNPQPPHIAVTCPVDKKTLFCQKCHEAGVPAGQHSHNTFSSCQGGKRLQKKDSKDGKKNKREKGKAKKAEAKEEEEEDDKEETKETAAKGKRVRARHPSPAGQPESSDDEQESRARRVHVGNGPEDKRTLVELPRLTYLTDTDISDSGSSDFESEHEDAATAFEPYSPSLQRGHQSGPACVPIKPTAQTLIDFNYQLESADIRRANQLSEKEEDDNFVDAKSHLEGEEDEFQEAQTCSSCFNCLSATEIIEASSDHCSPLPPMARVLNCAHKECTLESQEAEQLGGESAFVRRCRHEEICSQGLARFQDTPPMPVQFSMKASRMTKEGRWVISCPDTGASCSIMKESVARKCGLKWVRSKVSLSSATGQNMRVSGEAVFFARVKRGHTKRIRVVISPDLEDDCLISWSNQVDLGVLPSSWPQCMPQNVCEDEEDNEERCRGVRSEEENAEFPQEWPTALKELLTEFSSVFSDTLESDMRLKDGVFDLKLLPGATSYQTNRIQKLNYHERAATDRELQKLLDGRVLRRYDPTDPDQVSPWLFTAQWIPKMNRPDQFRLTADLVELNKRIEKDVYSFPSPTELRRKIKPDAKLFISLDAQSAFHQLVASKEVSRICTIALPQGQFQYLTGPQGCSNTGSAFCRYSDKVLAGTQAIKGIDDILLAGATLEELLPQLREVLSKAKEGGLTFSRKKVDFGKEVEFCGYLVTAQGVKPSPRKIQTIQALKPPTDETSLRSLLGLCQQFSHYHPDLSQTCKPLRELLKKGTEWNWGSIENQAFESLKSMMTTEMMAVAYDPLLPTRLLIDTSELGIGYLIAQWHQEAACHCRRTVCNCRWKVLWANSTTLKSSYKGVPPIYLELIGVRWAVQDAAFYLKGARSPFEIVTDHIALVGLSKKELHDVPDKMRSIFMDLRPYHAFWTHCPGARHLMADCLSRQPNTMPRRWVEEATTPDMDGEFCRSIKVRQVTATDTEYVWEDPNLQLILDQASQDPEYKELIRLVQERRDKTYIKNKLPSDHVARSYLPVWERLGLVENQEGDQQLVSCDVSRLVIPKGVDAQGNCDGHLRRHILDLLHVPHLGVIKSCRAATQNYHWPNMHSEVTQRCRDCQICEENQKQNPEEPPVEKHDLAAYGMEFVGSDLFHFDGNVWLIVVDFFSGWPLVKNLGKHSSTAKIIKRMTKWFNLVGYPRKLRADGGGEYRETFQEWCKQVGIRFVASSPYHPESNTRAEATLGNIKRLLRKCKSGGEDFERALSQWRLCPRADGPSCAELFFSRQVRSGILPQLVWAVPAEQNRVDRREQEINGRIQRTTRLPLPPFEKGDKVVMLDQRGKWTIPAIVRDIRPNHKSYIVETNSSVYLRNRKYLRLRRDSAEEEEEEQKELGLSVLDSRNVTPPSGGQELATQPGLETSTRGKGRREQAASTAAAEAPRAPVLTRARARQQALAATRSDN